MKILDADEIAEVNGGIAFYAVVTLAMVADASFWSSLSAAAGIGSYGGVLLSQSGGNISIGTGNSSPVLDALQGGNLGA